MNPDQWPALGGKKEGKCSTSRTTAGGIMAPRGSERGEIKLERVRREGGRGGRRRAKITGSMRGGGRDALSHKGGNRHRNELHD